MSNAEHPNGEEPAVCAVVPTFDRRELLLETLASLRDQTVQLRHTLVVDNASTDGTAEAVRRDFPSVEVLRLEDNRGSAGGFGAGLDWAVQHGCDWVWLMDNDAVAESNALAELLQRFDNVQDEPRPRMLASKVVWTDGSILPLNVPIFKRKDFALFYRAAEFGGISLRAAPYAGLLVHRSIVEQYGIPIEDYFLWNDDIEWTGRILRQEFGILVPTSVIVHKTPSNPTSTASAGPRFYFEVRNKLWMLLHSDAYASMEKVRFALTLLVDSARFLRRHRPPWAALVILLRGGTAGLLTRPQRRTR